MERSNRLCHLLEYCLAKSHLTSNMPLVVVLVTKALTQPFYLQEHASILLHASPTTATKVDQVPDLNKLENCYWMVRRTVEKRWAQVDAQKHCHQLL